MKSFLQKIRPSFLTRNIFLLSAISFFTDIASEMLYPVTPLYLKELGYGIFAIGIIEGIAECTAGISKVLAGAASDQTKKRNIFIQVGYSISAIVKPSIGFFQNFWPIFLLRFSDRLGKGLRTAPRDAILTDESTPEVRGRVFGFHRSIDTFGATLGPIITFIFIFFIPSYNALFLFAFIPGIVAIVLSFRLGKEKISLESPQAPIKPKLSVALFKEFLKNAHPNYKKLLLGFSVFALINGSNVFLLLRAKELGMPDLYILGVYVLYNLVYAFAAFPLGIVADKFGYKKIYLASLSIFAIVYGFFGMSVLSPWIIGLLFAVYGLFSAVEDSIVKAWLSLHIEKEHRATGLGLHMFFVAISFFVASAGTGLLWQSFGAEITFTILSLGAVGILGYFTFMKLEDTPLQ